MLAELASRWERPGSGVGRPAPEGMLDASADERASCFHDAVYDTESSDNEARLESSARANLRRSLERLAARARP